MIKHMKFRPKTNSTSISSYFLRVNSPKCLMPKFNNIICDLIPAIQRNHIHFLECIQYRESNIYQIYNNKM